MNPLSLYSIAILLQLVALLSIFSNCQQGVLDFQIPLAQTKFSSKLYQTFLLPSTTGTRIEIVPPLPENVVFSPFSIHTVLSMTMIGARNETFNEIALALGFPKESPVLAPSLNDQPTTTGTDDVELQQTINQYSREWSSLITLTNDSILSIANGIYIERSYPLSLDYLALIRDDFHSNVKSANFAGDAENERVEINSFVADRTNQLIKELIPVGAITSDTKLVLVNAIYFLGEWRSPFNKAMTIKGVFKQLSINDQTKEEQVDIMTKRDVFEEFGDNAEYNWLSMSYSNPNYQMTFIAPKTNQPFTQSTDKNFDQFIVDSLSNSSQAFSTHSTNMRQIKIPKFKIEFESELSTLLKDENGEFKMVTSFEKEKANFTAMISPKHPLRNQMQLWIDKVFHKAFIRVDEMGTEAAAATASIIVGRTTSIIDDVEVQRDFIIDRPFAFILKKNDLILFVGKVNKLF